MNLKPLMHAGESSRGTLLVRIALGWVFMWSGAMKLVFENQGPLRFAKLGLPAPEELAYFVGGVELVGGAMLALGLFTRLAALPLAFDMLVAIATTKLPLLVGAGPEPVSAAPKVGLWAFAYQARLDLVMLLCCAFLAAAGAGIWSLDAILSRRLKDARLMRDPLIHGANAPVS